MSPLGYQVPAVKASWCGKERQEYSDRKRAGRKGSGKNDNLGPQGGASLIVKPKVVLPGA